jgi:hypothetical protein
MNHIFCIAHKEITYKLPENTTIIWTGHNQVDCDQDLKQYRLLDASHEIEFFYPFLSGSAGTFAILELFLNKKLDISVHEDSITIFQYRKFLHPNCLGEPSSNYPGMKVIKNTSNTKPDPFDGVSLPDILISRPVNIGNLYWQYCNVHRPADLLKYTAIALDLGILSPKDSFNFLNCDVLIPGGAEFGTLPAFIFLKVMSKLEDICINFIKTNHPADLSQYQRRALSFCNERMGSYLLMKYLSEENIYIEDNMVGNIHCVTTDQQDYWASY